MTTYGYRVYLAWNGDEARGRDMERNINAAFHYKTDNPRFFDEDDPVFKGMELGKVKSLQRDISAKLYKKPCLSDEFDEVSLFNEDEYGEPKDWYRYKDKPPRTLYVRWEESQNTPYECFDPIFKMFPDLEFFLQCEMDYVSSDDSYRYQVFTYSKGRKTTLSNEEFDDFDAYDARCQKGTLELREWLGLGEEQFKTPEQCLAMVQRDGKLLRYVQGKNRRLDIQLAALKQNGLALRFIEFHLGNADDPDTANAVELCLAAVKQNVKSLRYVPVKRRTMEPCLAAVKQNGWTLTFVPYELKTAELCLAAVKQNGDYLGYVPVKLRTMELCLAAVKQNGESLCYVPKELMTMELCLAAVKQNGKTLALVPDELKTAELCLAAVKQNGKSLLYVPEELMTMELCLAAAKQNGESLWFAPKELRDEVVKAAGLELEKLEFQYWLYWAHAYPTRFKKIPEKYRTREICLIAVESYEGVCEYIPTALQSEEFFIEAVNVNTNGKALKYVPDEFRTFAVCLASIKKFPETIKYTPKALMTAELCLAAVTQNGKTLRYVPDELKTTELCLAAVAQAGYELGFVPKELKTMELCLAAVAQAGYELGFVPKELRTAELCLAAVTQNGWTLAFVPDELKTAELCLAAVTQNGKTLAFVPDELKTAELCLAAVKQNGDALKYAPEALRKQVKKAAGL